MNVLEATKLYTLKGWVIHPLSKPDDTGNSPGKKPLLTNWSELKNTPDDMGGYIKKGYNIGLVCGKFSGVDGMDIDLDLFTDELFEGVDLYTLTSRHRAGRGHILFQHEDDMIAEKHHFIGLEYFGDSVKGTGSNLVLPPSIHYSGELYQWDDADAPVAKIPDRFKQNWKQLADRENALHDYFKKCRRCFTVGSKKYNKDDDVRAKGLWDRPDDIAVHGMDGRRAILAIMGELRNVGCPDNLMHMACKRFFGKDYDKNTTEEALTHIKAIPPKCETLRQYLNVECDGCSWNPTKSINSKEKLPKIEYKTNGAFDYIDRITEKNPIFYDRIGQFWIWGKEGYYTQVDTTDILLIILRNISDPTIIKNTFKSELLEAARLRGRDAQVKPVPNNWIHIQNGVYDIKTSEFFDATPDYLFTEPIPHKISDSEETPIIDKLFSEWVRPEKISLLYEIASYCLYNGYPIHRMFVFIGRGRNGKGQFRDLIVNLVGRVNRTASTLEQLINSRFESARLLNKKVCTMGEINYTLLDRTAILKMLSGGDPIPGEMKNKTPFDFVNTAKLLINTNSLPQTSDKTDAFYSRCIIVEFCNQFQLGKDIIETIPQEEYDNFLTKTLRILKDLLARGEFTNEGDIRAKECEYERLSNPITQFINTHYERDPDGKVAAWRIMDKYFDYCSEMGFKKPGSKKEFNDALRINYEVEKKNLIDEETGEYKTWVWVMGIKTKVLSNLSNLSEFPLRAPHELPSHNSDKTDKTDKSDNNGHNEIRSLSIDHILPILDKNMDTKQSESNHNFTDLTKTLYAGKNIFEHQNGVINSVNISHFSFWFCDQFHPKWVSENESGYYQPSAILGIASKLFKLTPVAVLKS